MAKCPVCGGELDIVKGQTSVVCTQCSTAYRRDPETGRFRCVSQPSNRLSKPEPEPYVQTPDEQVKWSNATIAARMSYVAAVASAVLGFALAVSRFIQSYNFQIPAEEASIPVLAGFFFGGLVIAIVFYAIGAALDKHSKWGRWAARAIGCVFLLGVGIAVLLFLLTIYFVSTFNAT
jgi:hypothetical protein